MDETRLKTLIADVSEGRPSAAEELLPLVYDELRVVARNLVRREGDGGTLQPTALVNEACVRLLGAQRLTWNDRAHFLAIAAQAMRQILVSHARAKRARKRRASGDRIALSEIAGSAEETDVVALDEALSTLHELNPRHARLVELRFFGGLTLEEAAHVLDLSQSTANRDWRAARAWLSARLRDDGGRV